MGFDNPPIPWAEFERKLSGRRTAQPADERPSSRKRQKYVPAPIPDTPDGDAVPYAELHAHSNFSFLDGASSPEELLEEATRLNLHALALTDHDGMYGVVHLAEAAEAYDRVKTVFGAELSLSLTRPQNGEPDPEGSHLVVLARQQSGYHRLAAAITAGQLAGEEKGRPLYRLDELSEQAAGEWMVLTGCRKGDVRLALAEHGERGAEREVARLTELFGHDNVLVELIDQGGPRDSTENDILTRIAGRLGLPTVATNNVHYASPAQYPLATAVSAVRARRSLDELDGWLPAAGAAHLRSGAEMARRFARYPGAVERTVEIADDLAFRLRSARPRLPKQDVPEGHTPMSWLRELTWRGAAERYPDLDRNPAKRERIERELDVIEAKDFPGYFLIVHDIVRFARSQGILCQGRGSAANSAVVYLLGITAVDSIKYNLPFERFLSSMREEEPDIDVDFDSDRREEVIQYVYRKYGRHNAAQVANVITYRPKNAVRDMAKALGYSTGQQDAWSKQIDSWGSVQTSDDHDIPDDVVGLAQQVLKFPRHLGIHSGGMVLTDRPVGEVCPIEHARMEGRTVLQWDKDDCAWMGLVKFDLLGLGMLSALDYSMRTIEASLGEKWTLETIPKEEAGVYDMLCRADSIGVFQVESRAQIGTLPRLQPRSFYDLVIEIALIRPGPDPGRRGAPVHPPQARQGGGHLPAPGAGPGAGADDGRSAVPGAADADGGRGRRLHRGGRRPAAPGDGLQARGGEDRRAEGEAVRGDGAQRHHRRRRRRDLREDRGVRELRLRGEPRDQLRAARVRELVDEAALPRRVPGRAAARPADGLLLAADAHRRRPPARRRGAAAGHPAVGRVPAARAAAATGAHGQPGPTGSDACLEADQPPIAPFDRAVPLDFAAHRRDAAHAVRLGLAGVTSIGEKLAERIVAEREAYGPYRNLGDLARRIGLNTAQLEALAAAGAFEGFDLSRRQAIWEAGNAAQERPEFLAGTAITVQPPLLPMLSPAEQLASDLWSTGISTDDHPIRFLRPALAARGVYPADTLAAGESGRRIEVGGVVTHRQRPATAAGVTFLNIEDETGMVNVVCPVGVWNRYRRVARQAPAMIVRGILERSEEGVVNIVADKLESLDTGIRTVSRDFR